MSALEATAYRTDVAAFEAGDIDAATFDHAAHVYIAWCYLREYSPLDAIDRFTRALRSLTLQLGIAARYHETMTWFFILLIAERRAKSPDANWPAFCRENADLLQESGKVLGQYYSAERLRSAEAKELFLLPDRVPLRRDPRSVRPG